MNFTPETITVTRQWDEQKAELALRSRVIAIHQLEQSTFLELGRIIVEVRRRELWRHFSVVSGGTTRFCTSLDDWIHQVSGTSHGRAYAALRAIETLSHVPDEELENTPRCNLETMSKLSKDVSGDPEVRKAARELPEQEFTAKIAQQFPFEHVELKRPMMLRRLTTGSYANIHRACKMAEVLNDAHTIEDQIETLALDYMEANEQKYIAELKRRKAEQKAITYSEVLVQ